MNFLTRLYPNFVGGRPAVGLLIFRVITGLALMLHGWSKIQHPTSWMGPDAPVPAVMQFLAAIAEFGGGLALVLGLLTPIACIGIACVMLGALMLVHIPAHQPWIGGKGGSMEPAIGYLAAAILLFCTGPGRHSLDSRIFGTRRTVGYKDAERKEPTRV